MAAAISEVHIDNAHVRVTEWRFGSGDATGWHRHEFDYVITPLTGGELELVGPDGARNRAVLEPGRSYFREAGIEHDVINASADPLAFVEVELKSRPG